VNICATQTHPPIFGNGAWRRGLAAILPLLLIIIFSPVIQAADLAHLQSLVSQLGSDDPRVRAKALDDLMDIKRTDLAQLRSAAISQSPLSPGQIAGLRDAVAQVFLAGEKYPHGPSGFLGIRFSLAPEGVLVADRIRGFPAYRILKNGDVIVQLVDRPNIQFHQVNDFASAIMLFGPGDAVRFAIVRDGRAMTVSVPLDFRPAEISNTPADDDWIQSREKRAEAYWNEEFSVVETSGAPNASQASTSAVP
jgi:hypothetical protein